jgi:peptidoglycan/LPS O-acetylase OafA/YrhL
MMANDERIRFVTLDAMRGGAALIVAIAHFSGAIPEDYLAVDFFLVLSGFILAHRYLNGAPVRFRDIVAARIARLYPLHVLTLFGFALVTLVRYRSWPEYSDGTAWTFVLNLLLLQNVGLATSEQTWNVPSWSISVEFWVNVAFFAFVTRRTPSWLLLAVAGAALAVLAIFQDSLAEMLANYFFVLNSGLLRGVLSFLLGVVAFRAYALGHTRTVPGWVRLLVFAASLSLVLVARPGWERMDFVAPFVFSACVVLCADDSSRWRHWIAPLAYFGTISYSIYLVHYPIIYALLYLHVVAIGLHAPAWTIELLFGQSSKLVAYLCIVLVVSHLTFTWFERPSRAAVRRWLLPSRPDPQPVSIPS